MEGELYTIDSMEHIGLGPIDLRVARMRQTPRHILYNRLPSCYSNEEEEVRVPRTSGSHLAYFYYHACRGSSDWPDRPHRVSWPTCTMLWAWRRDAARVAAAFLASPCGLLSTFGRSEKATDSCALVLVPWKGTGSSGIRADVDAAASPLTSDRNGRLQLGRETATSCFNGEWG